LIPLEKISSRWVSSGFFRLGSFLLVSNESRWQKKRQRGAEAFAETRLLREDLQETVSAGGVT